MRKSIDLPELTTTTTITNWEIQSSIGTGRYCKAFRAIYSNGNVESCVKVGKDKCPSKQNHLKTEFQTLQLLRHPFILSLIEVQLTHESGLVLILELAQGSLNDWLRSQPLHCCSEKLAKRFFKQICQALAYAHDKKIIHGDVKLENVMIVRNQCKLSDWGFSYSFDDATEMNKDKLSGTVLYFSPDLLEEPSKAGPWCDVWALGTLLHFMLTGKPSFPAENYNDEYEVCLRIKESVRVNSTDGYLETTLAPFSTSLQNMVKDHIFVKRDKRATCEQLLLSKWLNEPDIAPSSQEQSTSVIIRRRPTQRVSSTQAPTSASLATSTSIATSTATYPKHHAFKEISLMKKSSLVYTSTPHIMVSNSSKSTPSSTHRHSLFQHPQLPASSSRNKILVLPKRCKSWDCSEYNILPIPSSHAYTHVHYLLPQSLNSISEEELDE